MEDGHEYAGLGNVIYSLREPPQNPLPHRTQHSPGQGEHEGSSWWDAARDMPNDSSDTRVGRTTYCVRIQENSTPIRTAAVK